MVTTIIKRDLKGNKITTEDDFGDPLIPQRVANPLASGAQAGLGDAYPAPDTTTPKKKGFDQVFNQIMGYALPLMGLIGGAAMGKGIAPAMAGMAKGEVARRKQGTQDILAGQKKGYYQNLRDKTLFDKMISLGKLGQGQQQVDVGKGKLELEQQKQLQKERQWQEFRKSMGLSDDLPAPPDLEPGEVFAINKSTGALEAVLRTEYSKNPNNYTLGSYESLAKKLGY
jgi:hypothetical protein